MVKVFVKKLIDELAGEGILVVSGLAFGIDCIAHKASIKNEMRTIGLLAHGLENISFAKFWAGKRNDCKWRITYRI